MGTYRDFLAKESPEMQARIAERVEEISTQIALSMLRDELNISQTEQTDNDPRLSTLKRYV